MVLSSEERLRDLRRKLLEEYDIPVRTDDELLGLAAVMIELIEQTTRRLEEIQTTSAEKHRQATVQAAEAVMQRAQGVASQAMSAATKASGEELAERVEHSSNDLRETLDSHVRSITRAVWVCTIAATLSVVAAAISLLK